MRQKYTISVNPPNICGAFCCVSMYKNDCIRTIVARREALPYWQLPVSVYAHMLMTSHLLYSSVNTPKPAKCLSAVIMLRRMP